MRLLSIVLVSLACTFARAADPVCALLDPDKAPLSALLEAKLIGDPGATWVERTDIDKILKEQQLQSAFAPQGVGERVKLGKLLKADVLVMVRPVKDAKEPTLELVVSETAGGLRLLVRAVPVTKNSVDDVAVLVAAVKKGMAKHGEELKEVIAVPPFASNDLEFAHDHLKGAYSKLVESAALDRKGVAVVELAEAEALAKEIALTDPGAKLKRSLPVYLFGEYRNEGIGDKRKVTLKLRAERGGKPIAKPAAVIVAHDVAAKSLGEWAGGVLDALSKDDRPRPPADAKAEAKVLAERAKMLARLESVDASLALAEASLLLDPGQVPLRAHAVKMLTILCREAAGKGYPQRPEIDAAVRFYLRGLHHFEEFHVLGGLVADYRNVSGGDFMMDLAMAGRLLIVDPLTPPKAIPMVIAAQREERETYLRIVPIVAKRNTIEERMYIHCALAHMPPAEKFALFEKVILELVELPFARSRVILYTSTLSKSPAEHKEFRAFLDRLAASKHATLREAAAELDKKPETTRPSIPTDPPGPGPGALKLDPIVWDTDGDAKLPSFRGILPVGRGIDLLWTNDSLYLMKQKGKPKFLWKTVVPRAQSGLSSVVFDGEYIWATVKRDKSASLLVAVDPVAEKVWDLSQSEGLPLPPDKPIQVSTDPALLYAAPLKPGRACLAGSSFGRAWIALATLDPKAGKASIKVILEAKEVQDRTDAKQWARTEVGFTVRSLVTLTGPANRDGEATRRVLVGRGGGENHSVWDHPLLVDPDEGTVEVAQEKLVWFGFDDCCILGGKLHYVRGSPAITRPTNRRGELVAYGLPELTHKSVPGEAPLSRGMHFSMHAHAGRIHVAMEHLRTFEEMFPPPGSVPPANPVALFEYWILDPDAKKLLRVASGVPGLLGFGTSEHYGLVAWTESKQGTRIPHTVEVATAKK